MGKIALPRLGAVATARASGTCGELLQGVLDGCDFLITAPIDRFSTAKVNLTTQPGIITSNRRPIWKAASALRKTLEFFHVTGLGAQLELESELPLGKGCASSTADIAATVRAGASALGYEIRPDEIAKIALSVEPSDGIFWSGIVLFDHVHGNLFEFLGEPPPLNILIVDPGGAIDTVHEFDREKSRAVARANEIQIKRAVELVKEGIRRQDAWLIGLGASISARCNQLVLHKPELEILIKLALNMNAVGVNGVWIV
ncbi:TPA: GHMP kinase, partial [Candidatus Poribacteria bacterium]|nr:GHMP kinase [Candidatus Poribacteria bacterium]